MVLGAVGASAAADVSGAVDPGAHLKLEPSAAAVSTTVICIENARRVIYLSVGVAGLGRDGDGGPYSYD